jgi:large subunit ribosomal protein L4
MEATIYNQKGQESGNIKLNEAVFGLPWNADLVHQVVVSMTSNERDAIAHTKTRGEVSGTGKKPWQQKGTGRARHGSRRSPIWVGGGVAHGPRNDKNYGRKINKKMKAKALYTILSRKLKDGEILFIDSLAFSAPKAKEAKAVLATLGGIKGFEKLATKKSNAALIAVPKKEAALAKSFGNFSNVAVDELRNINPLVALNYKYLVIANPKESLGTIENKLA